MSSFLSTLRLQSNVWRKPWLAVVLAIVAALLTASAFSYTLPKDVIEPRLRKALQRDTGYAIASMQSASFSAWPWPSIRIEQLELIKPGDSSEHLSIPLVKARLNLAAWISGNPRITALTLLRPQFRLAGNVNMTETEAMSATVFHELRRAQRPQLSTFRLIQGTVTRDAKPWISNLNLNVLNHVGHDMRVRANALVRGVAFRMAADINQTESHARRPIQWTLATAAGEMSFSGLLMSPRSLDAEGTFSLRVQNAGLVAETLGLSPEFVPALNGLRVTGETRIAMPGLQIREAYITRGAERLSGSVEINLSSSRPSVSATLHTEKFDVSPVTMPFFSPLTTPEGKWTGSRLPTAWMQRAQVDMRLSTDILNMGRHSIQNAALSAQLNNGRLELTLNDGRMNGGSVKGRMSFNAASDPPDMRLNAHAERMDFGALLASWNINRLKGIGSINLLLESRGSAMLDITGNANGRVSVGIRDGEIIGLDMDKLATRRDNAVAGTPARDGRTRFSRLQADVQVKDGNAAITETFLSRGPLRLPIEGKIQLQQQMLDVAIKLPTLPLREPGAETRIRIEGPWASPLIYPDLTGSLPRGKPAGSAPGRT